MKKSQWLKITALAMAGTMLLAACGKRTEADEQSVSQSETAAADIQDVTEDDAAEDRTEIQVFIAASLSAVMEEIASNYTALHPEVQISFTADSSGVLQQQIQEGFACDVFFSAAQKQVNALEAAGLVAEGSRANVVNNQVCVVTYKDSGTAVTGLQNIGEASSIALADGSVPVGKYTRQAMVNLGLLEEADDVADITTAEISDALGGVEISEQGNVSKVRTAVIEGSCEVGTVYYSDIYGFADQLDILEMVSYDLTGDVIYPVCMIENDEATDVQTEAAREFYEYILSDEAKTVFAAYQFDTNVER